MSDTPPITDDELAAMESQVRFLSSGVARDTLRLIGEVRRLRAQLEDDGMAGLAGTVTVVEDDDAARRRTTAEETTS